jgi:flagellar L-ring protein precursor FlgH
MKSLSIPWRAALLVSLLLTPTAPAKDKKNAVPQVSELDKYRGEVKGAQRAAETSPGSLWSPNARLLDIGADLRASRPGDIVTILVDEHASAVAKGTTKTTRASNVDASIGSAAGMVRPALNGMLKAGSSQSLAGDGETTRENTLRATLTARVSEVLPNGFLVIEGTKNITVNSETQTVAVRGVARPVDITTGNMVSSDRLALLEIKVNGKGVVNDAVRRPNFLYRLILGLLPF